MRKFEPENMDQGTLEKFAAESWVVTVLIRGVLIFGSCTFVGCCLTTVVASGSLSGDDLAANLAIAVVVGAVVGGYFRFAVRQEIRRRNKSA